MAEKFKVFSIMTVDVSKIKKVSTSLLKYPLIENIHELYGRFDVIAKIVGKNQEEVEKFINEKIRSVPAINRSETLVISSTVKETPKETLSELKEAEAYMLIIVKYGAKKEVSKKLAKFEEIENVHELFGEFDILIKIKAKTMKILEDFIQENVRSMKEIQETETLIVSDIPT